MRSLFLLRVDALHATSYSMGGEGYLRTSKSEILLRLVQYF